MARRAILLVGLSGSGKSTVGPIVARELGAPFVDLDAVIETRAGRSIAQIFDEKGERAFRAMEAGLGVEVLGGTPAVVATGGGFLEDQDSRRRALSQAWAVYLDTSPAVAASRLEGTRDRPLLKGQDAAHRLGEMLARREAAYLEAQCRVTTDGKSADEVAAAVVMLARQQGGW